MNQPDSVHRPIGKRGLAVDVPAVEAAPTAAVIRRIAMVAEHEIMMGRHHDLRIAPMIAKARQDIGLDHSLAVDIDDAVHDLNRVAGQADHALDEALAGIERIPEDHHIAALDAFEVVNKFVDEDPLVVLQARHHAEAFDPHRLVEEQHEYQREDRADGAGAANGTTGCGDWDCESTRTLAFILRRVRHRHPASRAGCDAIDRPPIRTAKACGLWPSAAAAHSPPARERKRKARQSTWPWWRASESCPS